MENRQITCVGEFDDSCQTEDYDSSSDGVGGRVRVTEASRSLVGWRVVVWFRLFWFIG
jgi:hypothetical protein